ncbi:FecR family protein [Chryseosolibacter indicus]|uniref:FecR domain-containing protein n=1 Tax=Chryseosolibacter indicus TaxID=2782351 RepID=A0ABS5VYH3_9BACT|nr:FecR family protein [Chryseosolibacter indicus]MBT1705799.1 FecR domain-containing protein [Chryseosolibacter indicus]
MKYQNYKAGDFIKDELFQKWVYSPDGNLNTFWNEFLAQYPDKQPEIEEARKFLRVLEFREEDIFESRISNLKKRIDQSISGRPDGSHLTVIPSSPPLSEPANRKRWWNIAAALVLLTVSTYVIFYFAGNSGLIPGSNDYNHQATGKGQRTIITLEDGTKVWLNAESKLSFPNSFDDKNTREVFLEGEGFFSVTKDRAKPFIVRTNGIMVKVLGTSFNVKSYNNDNFIQTTLVEGKVTLSANEESSEELTLAPNQVAVFDKSTHNILLDNKKNTDAYVGWTNGKLVFEDQPLSDIIVALERWYNIKFVVEDKRALKCRFFAKIDNLTLVEVLELFKASDGIEYDIRGDEVILSGLFCND